MKIGVIGATGKVGSLIAEEAAARGHEVTAIVRDASKLTADYPAIEKNIFDLTTDDIASFDVVVNAFGAPLGEEQAHVDAGRALIQALQGADTRALVVGGAGSLYVDEAQSVTLLETPEFPEQFKPTAKGQGQNLQDLKQADNIQWTFMSPSAMFDPQGARTGSYTAGGEQLLTNSAGESYISYADFAIAAVDEIEQPKHVNERFTVVGEKQE